MTHRERAKAIIAEREAAQSAGIRDVFRRLLWGVPVYVLVFITLLVWRSFSALLVFIVGVVIYQVVRLRRTSAVQE